MRHAFLRHPVVRLFARALVVTLVVESVPLQAIAATPAPRQAPAAPAPVHVNRTKPTVQPVPLYPAFSRAPAASEIVRARVFGEPLQPVGGEPTMGENEALAKAIDAYLHGGNPEALAPLQAFGEQYRKSPWWPSLLAGIGATHKRTGYFTRAAEELTLAWRLTKDAEDKAGRETADSALANLLETLMQFGKVNEIEAVLAEAEGREAQGAAVERLREARSVAWGLRNLHEKAVPSGPIALGQILKSVQPGAAFPEALKAFPATHDGASLTQMQGLARQVGLQWQLARRTSGAGVVVPSLMHLKSGHFSALTRHEGNWYVLDDPLLGGEVWLSLAALEDESSGYFLVPSGRLQAGWAAATAIEAGKVRGKCVFPMPDGSATGAYNTFAGCPGGEPCEEPEEPDQNCPDCAAAMYRIHALLASVNIRDTPVFYRPPRGPAVGFRAVYNHREGRQPASFYYTNLGSRWTFNWLSYVEDNPVNGSAPVNVYVREGGMEVSSGFSNGAYAPTDKTRSVVVRTSSSPIRYERRKANGWVEVFEQPDSAVALPRRVFMTQLRDPQGNAISMTYDSQLRMVAVTDAINQVTTLSYDNSADPLKLTKVTDPFGRSGSLNYDPSGQLVGIRDTIGLVSEMSYGQSGFVTSLKSARAAALFSQGVGANYRTDFWVQASDPLGGRQRMEFVYSSTAVPATAPAASVPAGFGAMNQDLGTFNGFYFGRAAMALHAGDYAKADHTRWMRASTFQITDRPHSALHASLGGARVWYGYAGGSFADQVGPEGRASKVALVLDDGSSAILRSEWNALGKRTRITDPMGRAALFAFAPNGIDRLNSRVKVGLAEYLTGSVTYNGLHRPLAVTDSSGQTATFAWNSYGQLATITAPPHDGLTATQRTTTLNYDSSGHVQSVAGPVAGATATFTYDGYSRIRTATDPQGYTVTLDYDVLNRPTRLTYPDGTYEEVIWEGIRPARVRDRGGRWRQLLYDTLGRLTSIRDALGVAVSLQWGGDGEVERMIDANGNVTRWERDGAGRVIKETRADGKATEYTYEGSANRLKEIKDPKGLVTRYEYFADNQLKRVSYPNAPSLPSVSFTYADGTGQLASVSDGTGTTTYSYYPVQPPALGGGRIQTIDGPGANDTITLTYDEMGRPRSRSVNGSTESVTYDALGRLGSVTNLLGTFAYGYDGTSARLASVDYPNGQQTTVSYTGASDHWRLQQILNKKPGGALLSRHAYTYDNAGNVRTWQQETDVEAPREYEFAYDRGGRLSGATLRAATAPNTMLKRYGYGYDPADNRTSQQIDDVVAQSTYNNLNQLGQIGPGGGLWFRGTTDEPATVSAGGVPASGQSGNGFAAQVAVGSGSTQVQVRATDASGNQRTNTYEVTGSGGTRTLTYDDNGNILADGVRTYEWNGLNELTAVNQGAHRSEVTYDSSGRRVRVVEKESGVAVEDWSLLWAGMEIVEEREALSGQVRRNFAGGVQQSGESFYLVSDHLGSVREMTDAAGTVRARYSYDPYGNRTKVSGDRDVQAGFAGMGSHSATGLAFAAFRAYDSMLGRWLSADPIGLAGGVNLYSYVDGNPISHLDPSGWSAQTAWQGFQSAIPGLMMGVGITLIIVGIVSGTAAAPFVLGFMAGFGLVMAVLSLAMAIWQMTHDKCQDRIDYVAGNLFANSLGALLFGLFGRATSGKTLGQYYYGYPDPSIVGTPQTVTLPPGTLVSRIGGPGGYYVSPNGTPIPARALPPWNTGGETIWEVLNPITVEAGRTRPWFGQPGGGMEYKLPAPLNTLPVRPVP